MDERTTVVRSLRERFLDGLREAAGPLRPQRPHGRRRCRTRSTSRFRVEGGRAVDEPRPGGRGLFGRLGLFERLAAAVAGAAGDGGAGGGAASAVRFSLSALNTEAEMDEAVRRIAAVVRRLRG